jgi:DHA1 family tetracycline resistance protein-like MFS transporter
MSLPETTPDISAPAATPSNRSALLIVFLVVFIDLLGFGIVLPLLPLYATELLEPIFPGQDAGASALRGALLGVLMSSFSLMQFIFAPIWGRISDRVGRRPILILGLMGSVAFYTLFGIASELGLRGQAALGLVLLFAARLGAGVAGATIATAQAVIADSTPPDKRAHGMALIGMAFGIGFTFGPMLGFASLFVDATGAPGFAAAGLSLIATLLAVKLLPEALRTGSPAARRRWFDWHGLRTVLATPTVGLLVLTFFLATFAFGGMESTLALVNKYLLTGAVERQVEVTREALKTVERNNFLVFAYIGLVLMLVQGLIYRRFVQRMGEVRFLKIGIILMILGLLGGVPVLLTRPNTDNHQVLIIGALAVFTVAVMGFAFLTPSAQALISLRSDPAQQGEILGVNQSASALARILGPLISVTLFFVTPSHVLPYVFGGGLLTLVLLLSFRIR